MTRITDEGLFLGSLAELFIVLYFFCCLPPSAVSMMEEKQKLQQDALDAKQEEINQLKSELKDEEVFGKAPLPEDFRKLVRQAAQAAQLKQENEKQKQLLSALKPIIDAIEAQQIDAQAKSELVSELAKAVEQMELGQIAKLVEAAENSPDLFEDLKNLAATLVANAKLEKENKELANLVEALGKERGDNPPCLFRDRDKQDRLYKKSLQRNLLI